MNGITRIVNPRPEMERQKKKENNKATFRYILIIFLMLVSLGVAMYSLDLSDKIHDIEARLSKAEECISALSKENENLQKEIQQIQAERTGTLK